MPNAKRPAGPTKPMHLEREKAIEREQMDEALGLDGAAQAANDDAVEPRAGTGDRAGKTVGKAGTPTDSSRPR
jgi:hypothetical protein